LYAQLTRSLFAIAKFLLITIGPYIFSRLDTIHERDGHPAMVDSHRATAKATLMYSIARQ